MTENGTASTEVDVEVRDADRPVSIFDVCETDADATENGKWFSDIWEGVPAKVKLRRFTSHKSINTRQRLMNRYRRHLKNNKYPPEIEEKMLIDQMAEAILIDWSGIYDREGNEIAFSVDAAKMLLKMIDFRHPLVELAMKMDGFRAEEVKETAGN